MAQKGEKKEEEADERERDEWICWVTQKIGWGLGLKKWMTEWTGWDVTANNILDPNSPSTDCCSVGQWPFIHLCDNRKFERAEEQ